MVSLSAQPVFMQLSVSSPLHPSVTHLSCSKSVTSLTYRHCKCSSSHWVPHTLPERSRAEWSFCLGTGGCSLPSSDNASPLRWRRPGLSASARHPPWQTAEAGSPAEPRSPAETGKGSGGAWPGLDKSGRTRRLVNTTITWTWLKG